MAACFSLPLWRIASAYCPPPLSVVFSITAIFIATIKKFVHFKYPGVGHCHKSSLYLKFRSVILNLSSASVFATRLRRTGRGKNTWVFFAYLASSRFEWIDSGHSDSVLPGSNQFIPLHNDFIFKKIIFGNACQLS